MCSVTGIISKSGSLNPDADQEIGFLLGRLHHRGPDSRAALRCAPHVLLGSNRLRITDAANPQADMPMVAADGRTAIVFNGEIYNHLDLRRDLAGYPFRTNSDTEVLLAAYLKWGPSCLDRLEGMYAFCIYDGWTNDIFMAADPTGQKKIYLYEDGNDFVFASEIDALIADPFRNKTVNWDAMGEYVAQRFIVGADTHIKEINKIEPGTWMRIDPRGQKYQSRFYHLPLANKGNDDPAAAMTAIHDAVRQGCRSTFNLEVSYGLLLSGGIDSAAVLAAGHAEGLRFKTYSVGFRPTGKIIPQAGSVFDEFEHSRFLARHYDTDHHEIVLDDVDYCDYLDRWADMSGEPLGSQEAPCLIRLFEQASGNVRVMFTGSGPDEVFDGYSYGQKLSSSSLHSLPVDYFNSFHWAGDADFKKLVPGHDPQARVSRFYGDVLDRYQGKLANALQAVQAMNFHGRLSVYEFQQIDTVSMRHSIECRSPLADRRLIAAAFSCDPSILRYGGEEKGVYKQALKDLVPPQIVARKKQGFPVPAEMWFSKPFEDRARSVFDSRSILAGGGFLNRAELSRLWNNPDPATRNIFSRLYTAERILQKQVQSPAIDRPGVLGI